MQIEDWKAKHVFENVDAQNKKLDSRKNRIFAGLGGRTQKSFST